MDVEKAQMVPTLTFFGTMRFTGDFKKISKKLTPPRPRHLITFVHRVVRIQIRSQTTIS